MARSSGGLTRWFKENWVDVKTGKPCGRSKGENRAYTIQYTNNLDDYYEQADHVQEVLDSFEVVSRI